jgi:hypothetical protein
VSIAVVSSGTVRIRIGRITIGIHTRDQQFLHLLETRYRVFVAPLSPAEWNFHVEIQTTSSPNGGNGLQVTSEGGIWRLQRDDFLAEWNEASASGTIRQTANPYSIDTVIRIVHSLMLAKQGGFLLHAAGAIRNDVAFLFTGVSGAGKTTISRLAPEDVVLLTDEISYIRQQNQTFYAFGTPFAGELERNGADCSAPLKKIFVLTQGPENRVDSIAPNEAVRLIMRNILFFARNPELVESVFQTACRCVSTVSVQRLTFTPQAAVWELIQ